MTTKRSNKENRWRYFSLIRRWMQAGVLLAFLLSTTRLHAQVKVLAVSRYRGGGWMRRVTSTRSGVVRVWGSPHLSVDRGRRSARITIRWGYYVSVNAINEHSQMAGVLQRQRVQPREIGHISVSSGHCSGSHRQGMRSFTCATPYGLRRRGLTTSIIRVR